MDTNTLPPFDLWSQGREPNRNRWQKELTKLIVENAEVMASDHLNERDALINNRRWKPTASSVYVLAGRAGIIALWAEYDALKEAAESLFPSAAELERDLPAAYARAEKALPNNPERITP